MPACIGGHLTVPYEQNTQQSPSLGNKMVSQLAQLYLIKQTSVGNTSIFSNPHFGHEISDFRDESVQLLVVFDMEMSFKK